MNATDRPQPLPPTEQHYCQTERRNGCRRKRRLRQAEGTDCEEEERESLPHSSCRLFVDWDWKKAEVVDCCSVDRTSDAPGEEVMAEAKVEMGLD